MRIPLLMLIAAGLAAPQAHAQLFKCVQGGKTVYQDAPCEQGSTQNQLRGRGTAAPTAPAEEAAAPAKATAAPANANTTADVESVVTVLSGYQACANDLDGYAAKHAAGYNGWRTRNQASIAKYNSDPEAQKRVRANLEEALRSRPQDAQGVAGRSEECDGGAARWFGARPGQ